MKRKVWELTVLDNPNRAIGGESDMFYTTDTEAFLVFNLSDENFNPTEAMLTLVNTADRSVVSEEVAVTDGTIKWEMREEIIEHAGNWQAQLIYKQMKGSVEEKYTSQIVTFNVLGHLLDTREVGIVAIENWNNFVKDAEDLFADWADLEDLRQANEAQRQANYQELLDTGVLQTNINNKLEQLEEEYAPTFAEVTAQLAQTEKRIDNLTIDLTDFLVADGVTDDYDNLMNAFRVEGHRKFIFPQDKEVLIGKEVDLLGTDVVEVDLNGSTLLMPNGGFKSRVIYVSYPAVFKRGTIKGSGVGRGFSIGEGRDWGSAIHLEDITIRDFEVGFYGTGLYFSSFKNLDIRFCQIGIHLGSEPGSPSTNINNALDFNLITLLENTYNLYIDNTLNSVFNNVVMQHADYAIVFGGGSSRNQWLQFNNPWFEQIEKACVTFGTIDLNTYELVKATYERRLEFIEFNNSYYYAIQPFIDPHFPFASLYYEEDGYYTRKKELFKNHLPQLDNIQSTLVPANAGVTDSATSTVEYKKTMFGNLLVNKISGVGIDTNTRVIARALGNFSKGDKLLFKFLIKVNQPDNKNGRHNFRIRTFFEGTDITHIYEPDVPKQRWQEVSFLLEPTRDAHLIQPSVYINNTVNNMAYSGYMEVEIANFMIVNLTDTIGSEAEITRGMIEEISSMIPYKLPGLVEQGRFVGETVFDKDTSKTYTWSGLNWVDALGNIHEPQMQSK